MPQLELGPRALLAIPMSGKQASASLQQPGTLVCLHQSIASARPASTTRSQRSLAPKLPLACTAAPALCVDTHSPQVRSNALDVMMAAVVGMSGDTGAPQEHRVELALAALAAASGMAAECLVLYLILFGCLSLARCAAFTCSLGQCWLLPTLLQIKRLLPSQVPSWTLCWQAA